jgi:hypothetical protein
VELFSEPCMHYAGFFFNVGPAAIPHRVQYRLQGSHQHGPHHQVRYRYKTQLLYTIIFASVQCCGSGIQCLFDPGIQCLLTPGHPGFGMGKKINIRDPENEQFFGLKILKFFDAEPDPGSGIRNLFDLGSWIRDGKIRIRDKHPGSATLPPWIVC